MPGSRIPALTPLTAANSAGDDSFVVFDASADTTKRMSRTAVAEAMTSDVPTAYTFTTTTLAAAKAIPEAVTAVVIADGRIYSRVEVDPDHPGSFQSADGAWWELMANGPVRVEWFGFSTANGHAANTAAFDAARDTALALGVDAVLFPATNEVEAEIGQCDLPDFVTGDSTQGIARSFRVLGAGTLQTRLKLTDASARYIFGHPSVGGTTNRAQNSIGEIAYMSLKGGASFSSTANCIAVSNAWAWHIHDMYALGCPASAWLQVYSYTTGGAQTITIERVRGPKFKQWTITPLGAQYYTLSQIEINSCLYAFELVGAFDNVGKANNILIRDCEFYNNLRAMVKQRAFYNEPELETGALTAYISAAQVTASVSGSLPGDWDGYGITIKQSVNDATSAFSRYLPISRTISNWDVANNRVTVTPNLPVVLTGNETYVVHGDPTGDTFPGGGCSDWTRIEGCFFACEVGNKIEENTVSSAPTTTQIGLVTTAGEYAATNDYTKCVMHIVDSGVEYSRVITAFNTGTRVCTIESAFPFTVTTSHEYRISYANQAILDTGIHPGVPPVLFERDNAVYRDYITNCRVEEGALVAQTARSNTDVAVVNVMFWVDQTIPFYVYDYEDPAIELPDTFCPSLLVANRPRGFSTAGAHVVTGSVMLANPSDIGAQVALCALYLNAASGPLEDGDLVRLRTNNTEVADSAVYSGASGYVPHFVVYNPQGATSAIGDKVSIAIAGLVKVKVSVPALTTVGQDYVILPANNNVGTPILQSSLTAAMAHQVIGKVVVPYTNSTASPVTTEITIILR